MKERMKIRILTTLFVGIFSGVMAWNPPDSKNSEGANASPFGTKAANCVPPTELTFMQFNDVRALIETGGMMWQDRYNNRAAYQVPKPPADNPVGPSVLYAGALWMGGTDVNGQLKLAAQLFGATGRDFWTGPLTVNPNSGDYDPSGPVYGNVTRPYGAATITPQTCQAYDKFFTIRKSEVSTFIRFWECNNDEEATGCEEVVMNNEVLNRILNWPAHGDVSLGQDYYLAPFYDRNKDGIYNPALDGDYPWYDFEDEIDCRNDRRITLFGDETHWWVFNDKGNIHNETGGDPIGMEVRAQAFSFATGDEINKMTFYNYEMINRGTQTLQNTYFAQYADADIGCSENDYAGCDVSRGLGYTYNGTLTDPSCSGSLGYEDNPPAVGIDFFEGPYQDDDGRDNVGPSRDTLPDGSIVATFPTVSEARADNGIVYPGLGIGYGDGVVDNERYGMKRYISFSRIGFGCSQSGVTDDPVNAVDFYRLMNGIWKNGERMSYGGCGNTGTSGNNPNVITDYMFPGESDPLGWGTPGSSPQAPWSEVSTGNPVGDRRFVQAAGPFTLRPGAVNNITVGVVYARSTESDIQAPVRELFRADTKAQALFDNCFQILEPPTAPRLQIQELENELILMISNPSGNNVNEQYQAEDRINIIDVAGQDPYDKIYRFEGYQIYQLKDATVSVADLEDSDLSRLVIQCDIKNGVSRLINYEFDEELGVSVPNLKVDGADKGIRHTFKVTEDQFGQGDRTLVNHKTYYYLAIAYAYNNFKEFNPDDPLSLDGQKLPYISSRLSYDGSAISSVAGIPHNPMPGAGGTYQFASYGTVPQITRVDGMGNMGLSTELTRNSVNTILQNNLITKPVYRMDNGPLDVKVVDPLNVTPGHYELRFNTYGSTSSSIDTASWTLYRYVSKGGAFIDSVASERTIKIANEQVIPEWGISVNVEQKKYYVYQGFSPAPINELTLPLEATIEFGDSSKAWLMGVPDTDDFGPQNWILSGKVNEDDQPCYVDNMSRDGDELYENLLGGIITHFSLLRTCGPAAPIGSNSSITMSTAQTQARLASTNGVDIVFTSDKSKWTRSVVIELCQEPSLAQGNGVVSKPRKRASVDKNGLSAGQPGYNAAEGDLVSPVGMGWFPGYAIDIETGRRLNIVFGENSFLGGEFGADMLWNPTSKFYDNVGNAVFGGQHVIYIVQENVQGSGMPIYDNCQTFFNWINGNVSTENRNAWRSVSWVMYPLTIPNRQLLATDTRIKMRVSKAFENRVLSNENGGRPMFEWDMTGIATQVNQKEALVDALEMINVVPNPYYAYSQYERDRIDTRVKITNLPEKCQVKIFNVRGKLINSFDKDSPITSLDWDLKNFKGIPVAGGVYIIHIDVPGVGEKILKWFGGVRQPDLENL